MSAAGTGGSPKGIPETIENGTFTHNVAPLLEEIRQALR
jgi:hypothetical protein